ncbi:MAG: MATE family efflux transporter [Lachnospiraceae bacterium]|nr:MATE family efflux transporter [Lachnospiraceae bacterium]
MKERVKRVKSSAQGGKDMTKGEPFKLILMFSIPLLLGNIFQQFYSMVDTIIVGKIIGTQALAAVGTTGPLNFLVLGFASGITSGFAVLVAQRFGAGDEKGMKKAVAAAVELSAAFTIVLTLLATFGTKALLHMINTPEDIFQGAYEYIVVIFGGMFTMILYNLLACILRALGDSKTPLYFLIISSVLNIVLDLVFIVNFEMGVAGAAWATVISQGVSGVLCLVYMMKKYPVLHLTKEDLRAERWMYARHLFIGLPMAFQFSITAIGTVILQGALNLFGSNTIAAYTAACKVEQLVTQPAGTFGVTMANYSGQNLGADRVDRIKEGVTKCTILTLLFAVLASLILVFFGEPLTKLFIDGNQPEVVETAMVYLKICAIFFPFLNMIFVYRNMLQGVGKSLMPLMAGVFELIARGVVSFTLPAVLGFTGICLAGPVAWMAAAIPLGITYFIEIKKMMREWKLRQA